MRGLFRVVITLVVLGFAGLVAFAYLGDMAPPQAEVVVPVDLDAR